MVYLNRESGTDAVAQCADGKWRFKKTWFPFEKVTLHPVDFETEVAVLRNRLVEKRSSLQFPYGQTYYWASTNFWLNRYVFTSVYGDPLINFKRNSNPFTVLALPKGACSGTMAIEPPAGSLPELPILILLGCYLMIIDSI